MYEFVYKYEYVRRVHVHKCKYVNYKKIYYIANTSETRNIFNNKPSKWSYSFPPRGSSDYVEELIFSRDETVVPLVGGGRCGGTKGVDEGMKQNYLVRCTWTTQ